MISSGNSYRLDQSLAIWFPSRKRLLPPLELVWMELSIPCGPLNMPWRCSGGRYRLVPHAVVSTGSPIASQRSSPKRANSARPESGQTLAGYVSYPEVKHALICRPTAGGASLTPEIRGSGPRRGLQWTYSANLRQVYASQEVVGRLSIIPREAPHCHRSCPLVLLFWGAAGETQKPTLV